MSVMKTLALGATLATSLVAVTPASALVVKYYFSGGTGSNSDTFSLSDSVGTLPAKYLNETASSCGHVAKACTYDFLFQLAGVPANATSTFEVAAQAFRTVVAEPISFNLFSGAPGSVASLAAASNPNFLGASDDSKPTSPVLGVSLADGSYYVQIAPSQVAVSGEASSGSLVESAPEPASWSLMLLGVGVLGGALRRDRRAAPSAA